MTPEQFDELVRENRALMLKQAVGIVHDCDVAADICQEVFVKAMREPRIGTKDFRTRAWLCTVTRNLAKNWVRDMQRRKKMLADNIDLLRTPNGLSPAALVYQEQLRRKVLGAFEHLHPVLRDAALLHFYEDMNYPEIAQQMGVPMGSVSSRLARARGGLAAAFDKAMLDMLTSAHDGEEASEYPGKRPADIDLVAFREAS